jgi:hypothetical protein
MNIFEDIMIANYASISPFLPFFSAKIKKNEKSSPTLLFCHWISCYLLILALLVANYVTMSPFLTIFSAKTLKNENQAILS